jgi:aspartyl aminopeptidase
MHAGTTALFAVAADNERNGGRVPVLAAFDHEEIRSQSATGAAGPLPESMLLRRLAGGDAESQAQAFASSLCVSSDVGHAVHPNYPRTPRARPLSAAQRQADPQGERHPAVRDGRCGAGHLGGRLRWAGVGWQLFVANNSIPCGSTIGPITATRLGVDTIDIEIPILAMHSVRELCGAGDPLQLTRAATSFFAP